MWQLSFPVRLFFPCLQFSGQSALFFPIPLNSSEGIVSIVDIDAFPYTNYNHSTSAICFFISAASMAVPVKYSSESTAWLTSSPSPLAVW